MHTRTCTDSITQGRALDYRPIEWSAMLVSSVQAVVATAPRVAL